MWQKEIVLEKVMTFIYTFGIWCSSTETPTKRNVVETTECYHGRGEGYRGTADMTNSGLTCQRWDSQHPHNHNFIPEAYPCKWVRGSCEKDIPSPGNAPSHLNRLRHGFLCVFKGPERELLSEPRWSRIPLVLHDRPKSPHDALHQHPSVQQSKQACHWWETQQLCLKLKSAWGKPISFSF